MIGRIVTSLFLCVPFLAFGQFGVTGSYLNADVREWETLVAEQTNSPLYNNGYKVGIDYWFRLKNIRIEFMPEVGYSNMEAEIVPLDDLFPNQFQTTAYHFQLNTNIYAFNIATDCECPTWSKSEPILQKGFFFQLSPGVAFFQQEISREGQEPIESEDFTYTLAAGAGLDIGVSDLLTITPMVKYWYIPEAGWAGLDEALGIEESVSSISYLEFALRIGVRFDYK
jgi:hypothetical protein